MENSVSSSQCFPMTTVSLEIFSDNSILACVFLYLLSFSLGFRSLSREVNHDSRNWIQQRQWLKPGSRTFPAFGQWNKWKSSSQKEGLLLHRLEGLVLTNITINCHCCMLRNAVQGLTLWSTSFFPVSLLDLNTHQEHRGGLDLISVLTKISADLTCLLSSYSQLGPHFCYWTEVAVSNGGHEAS